MDHRGVEVVPIPVLDTNYVYLVVRGERAVAIDAGEAAPVRAALAERRLRLTHILITHAHHDHVGGLAELRRASGASAWGPDGAGIEPLDRHVAAGDFVDADGLGVSVIDAAGHLAVQVAYHLPAQRVVFAADCLFVGGCGRLFGPWADRFVASLARLAALPGDTAVYCGHEYAADNLAFAAHIEPGNGAIADALRDAKRARGGGTPSVPSTIARERATNPFLRLGSPEIRRSLGIPPGASDVDAFTALRAAKDRW